MSAQTIEHPFYPIIFVRGYAGSQAAVEDTVADPYMGFNIGSTKLRQLWTGNVERHYFESPLVRLMKDFSYRDVYEGGDEMPLGHAIVSRSVFIYRYYDQVSMELGPGIRPELETYAKGLGELILRIRDRLCGDDQQASNVFKVYLVAHSMGGLICRCLLQNPEADPQLARQYVDKVFTYATPHNGIDLRIIGNVPGFFSRNNADNFNRQRMHTYLDLPPGTDEESVATLNGKFDPDRFFCLVGTNHRDYEVAAGWSSRVVGPMSDGLVRITNATVCGPWHENGQEVTKQAPRAFVYRSHSGHYGIVNSEEGYQNLTRFLFGDVRVDGMLEVKDLCLPPDVERSYKSGKKVRASYHFEVVVRTRGSYYDLHRRTVNEESAVFRRFDEMLRPDRVGLENSRDSHLFSVFLSTRQRVNKRRRSLGFSVDLGVLVPQYEVDGFLMFDNHYEGGYLFRDGINLEAIPPDDSIPTWRLRYGFDSQTPNRTTKTIDPTLSAGMLEFRIPIEQKTRPGISAELVLNARAWNMESE